MRALIAFGHEGMIAYEGENGKREVISRRVAIKTPLSHPSSCPPPRAMPHLEGTRHGSGYLALGRTDKAALMGTPVLCPGNYRSKTHPGSETDSVSLGQYTGWRGKMVNFVWVTTQFLTPLPLGTYPGQRLKVR